MKKGTPHVIGVYFHIVLYMLLSIFFSLQIREHILMQRGSYSIWQLFQELRQTYT